jgi:hypothetical protein
MIRWVEVALPLTILTGLIVGTGMWIADGKRKKEMKRLREEIRYFV